MIDDPKEKKYGVDGNHLLTRNQKNRNGFFSRIGAIIYAGNLLQLFSALLLFSLGGTVVGMAILGLMQPLWLSTILSMVGSVAFMTGFYILYNLFSDKSNFDTLINRAIQRVIRNQN